jgi:hypothetical protein
MPELRNMSREAWPAEREGYSEAPAAAYSPAGRAAVQSSGGSSIRMEGLLGGLMTLGGAGWISYVVMNGMQVSALVWNSHPVELTGIGLLIWLHAKYRRATRVK